MRVAGPFTVESISPHRVLGVDENGDVLDGIAEPRNGYGTGYDFGAIILDNLRRSGVQQAHKEDRITFTSLMPWPGRLVCAEGKYIEGATSPSILSSSKDDDDDAMAGPEKRAGIFIGPEFGTVSRPDLVEAAREAAECGFDVLIACAFNYDAHTTEFESLGRVPVLKARMNADLHMAGELKNTGNGNLFVIFGEPDIDILEAEDDQDPGAGQRRGRVPSQHRRGAQRWAGGHRLLVHRHRLRPGELLRSPRLFPRRQRPVQVSKDHAEGRDRRRRLGHPAQRHLAPVPQAGNRPHRRQGNQPPGRRGDEGVSGGMKEADPT